MSGKFYSRTDLRNRPDFLETVADRVWRAWWKDTGAPLTDLINGFRRHLGPGPVPTTFVAHQGDVFYGTISLIENDLAERPQYSPWVAALWIDEAHRGGGKGRALLESAAKFAFFTGHDRVYLCAGKRLRDYYLRRGWSLIESGVGEHALDVFARERETALTASP